MTYGKAYFQPDIMGSTLFAAAEAGNVLGYAPRDIWGGLKQPMQGDMPELEAAFGRGGLSGAAISGLDYLSGSLEAQKARNVFFF